MKNDILKSVYDLESEAPEKVEIVKQVEADFLATGGNYRVIASLSYDGQKNFGEAGPIINYILDYEGLRYRSWQMLIESDVAQTVIGRHCTWIIGKGLKLTSEPAKDVLVSEGVTVDTLAFSKTAEQRFNLFKSSLYADYSNMKSLDAIAWTAFLNSIVGGDVLVVLRYDGKNVTTQLIDGCHLQSPMFGTESFPEKLENGNEIINGIEFDAKKKHVKYYVRNKDLSITEIPAFGAKSGLRTAFLVKGLDFRLDNVRGIPLISAVIEKMKKMERYDSATLSGAEEVAKVAFQITHKGNSTGESPLAKQMATIHNYNKNADVAEDVYGEKLANKVAASTNKQVFNMGIDSELKPLDSKSELYYKDYYTTNITSVCAALGIPYQVAMSLYEGNFSASRAALKDWENTIDVLRKKFSDDFYQPIFNYWLEVQILENKIQAPGYIQARLDNNIYVVEAYRKCRFTGSHVPHIDPLKEVMAVREALGETGKDLPLITLEYGTESLNGSESHDNMIQYATELEESKKLGIVSIVPPVNDGADQKEKKKKKIEALID